MVIIKKEIKSYRYKIIETPTTIEVWEYLDDPVFYYVKDNIENIHSNNDWIIDLDRQDNSTKVDAYNQYDSLKRKQRHYQQMRWEIARIVDCNFDNSTKFMTLTFKTNEQDITFTNSELNKFIKRLNYHFYKLKKQSLKYLSVWEKQKRGAIHYHIIFFNFPFIKIKDLQTIWGHGFVKLNKIDLDSQENRGRYVSKYFSKDLEFKEYKKKTFFKSQNLKKPLVRRINSLQSIDLSNGKIIYVKEYTRNIPDFLSPNQSFKDSTVRYSKYRKGLTNNKYSK